MHHAVVRTHVHHRAATLIRGLEGTVAGVVGIRERVVGFADRHSLRAFDVADEGRACAIGAGAAGRRRGDLIGAVAAQIVEVVGAVVVGVVGGVERRQLRVGQARAARRTECHGGSRDRVPACDAAPGVPATAAGLRFKAVREEPDGWLLQHRVSRDGVEVQDIGLDFAGPALRVVQRRIAGVAGLCHLRQRGRERGGVGADARRDVEEGPCQTRDHLVRGTGGEVVVGAWPAAVRQGVGVGVPPGLRQGRGACGGVETIGHLEAAVFRRQQELVVRLQGLVFHDVEPVGRDRLHAQCVGLRVDVGPDVAGVHVVGNAGHQRAVVGTAAVVGVHGAQRRAETLHHADAVGGGDGIDRVAKRGLGRFVGREGIRARDVLVGVRVRIADAENEVALARVLDRVVPGGDHREVVDPLRPHARARAARHVGPGIDVAEVLEVAHRGVVKLADRVIGLV